MAHHIQKGKSDLCNPEAVLQGAIEKLELFTQQDTANLEIEKNGRLVAVLSNPLERIVNLARNFVRIFFSDQIRYQKEKLNQIKEEILNARDIIQSHSALIGKLKEGNSDQQKLAQWALEAIKRYNIAVTQIQETAFWSSHDSIRNRLLLDREIKGKQIELPDLTSIKYDSHPNVHLTQKTFKELSETFAMGTTRKNSLFPTHKKTVQVMIDAFRLKAMRMVQEHLIQHHLPSEEVLNLIKQTPIEIEDEEADLISMYQILEIVPGSTITLIGAFKRNLSGSKLMSIPILDHFRFNSQFIQTGFPYPSQHTSWALADDIVNAYPLRIEQTPLFQQTEQRKKQLARALLFDSLTMTKAKRISKLKKDVFNSDRPLFINLQRELNQTIIQAACFTSEINLDPLFDQFYAFVESATSSFDVVTHTQQKLIHLFINHPAQILQKAWLEEGVPLLRTGSHQEKYLGAYQLIKAEEEKVLHTLNREKIIDHYLFTMGQILGQASHSIILQYMSEKIGFAPPVLNCFEKKVQLCAFHHLLTFLNNMEREEQNQNEAHLKKQLEEAIIFDTQIFKVKNVNNLNDLSVQIINELEIYFNSRFHAINKKIDN